MKHLNRYHLGILPLLSILAMSPSVMESNFNSRAIASVVPEEKVEVQTEVKTEVSSHPKLEALVSKVDPKSIMQDADINIEKFKIKREELKAKLVKESAEFKKNQSDKDIVAEQRKKVENLVIDLILVEGGLKGLQEKKAIEASEEELSVKLLAESKDTVEGLLSDLEANEVLVAKASEPKPEEPKKEEEKPVIADDKEPKKEEPKVEEPKKEEVVVVKEEPKKEEPKVEEPKKEDVVVVKEEPKKEEVKKEVCESDEKNKVLTTQVEDLMKQNQQILQTMMGMAQMMLSMHQQSQNQNIYQQHQQMPMPNPYMYQQPMTAGNWVYYPSGFQPNQQNIFAQPQMQQPMQQQMSMYPDQMYQQQQQPQWNMRPSQYFGDQRFQTQPIMPGTFGNEAFTFNMGNSVPTITQL